MMIRLCRFAFFLLALFIFSLVPGNVSGQSVPVQRGEPGKIEYVGDELLVRFKSSVSVQSEAVRNAHGAVGAKVLNSFPNVNGLQLVKLPQGVTVEQAIASYQKNTNVLFAEPNYIYQVSSLIPNDPSFNLLWGLEKINAPGAWEFTTGSNEVIIAVIDSGVDWSHPDLADNIWTNPGEELNGVDSDGNGFIDDIRGWDFYQNDNNPADVNGHGTHVAGTIAAAGNNNIGIAGVMWNVKIMPIRAFGPDGTAKANDLLAALEYANANGAHVINNSWGGLGFSESLKDAICASPAIVVCAAGNAANNNDILPVYPASYGCDNIISVAATTIADTLAPFSNYGASTVHVAAPGVNILSTVPRIENVWHDDCQDLSIWNTNFLAGFAVEPWGLSNTVYATAPASLQSNPSGAYQPGEDSHIILENPLTLPNASDITLIYKARYDTAPGDGFFPFISTDGISVDYLPGWQGSSGPHFLEKKVDLSPWAGQTIWLGFNLWDAIVDGNQGAGVWIDDIRIAVQNGSDYLSLSGTSMAAPHVAGLAGLIKAANPALTPLEIKDILTSTVDDLGLPLITGGRINAFRALDLATIPVVETSSPANGASGVSVNAALSLTFSEPVNAVAGKYIRIHTSADDTEVEAIEAADMTRVMINGPVVTIVPTDNFALFTNYYITIDQGAFEDNAGNKYTGISTSTVWSFTTEHLPEMGGSVSISGEAKYGGVITADLTGITYTPATGDDEPAYQWQRGGHDIVGATASSYTLELADIGQAITVTVTADGVHAKGSVTSPAVTAEKADGPPAPPAPLLEATSHSSITLEANTDYQYRINEDAWQDSNAFSGLLAETEYLFTVRFKETATHNPSAASAGLIVTTQAAPVFFTVSFDSNGGSDVAGQEVESGNTAMPIAPTRSGYTFAGWHADAALTQPYDFATPVTADLILYAKWTQQVIFGGGGAALAVPGGTQGISRYIDAAVGGSVSFNDATAKIPAGALPANASVRVAMLDSNATKALVHEILGLKLRSTLYEITTTGSRDFGTQTITIKIAYERPALAQGEVPVMHYYDEDANEWVALRTTVEQDSVSGKWYAVVHVNHLTKFAVFSRPLTAITLTIGRLESAVGNTPYTLDAPPYIEKETSRTLVPLRFISEALGANVDWLPRTRQIIIADGKEVIVLTPGSGEIVVNGVKQRIDSAPTVQPPGRTFVPLRVIGEILGAKLEYNNATKVITITK